MNKQQETKEKILRYLSSYNIAYKLISDEQEEKQDYKNTAPLPLKILNTIYIPYEIENAPGNLLESDIRLYDNNMLARAYYSSEVAAQAKQMVPKRKNNLLRVLNFVNEVLFFGYDVPYTSCIYLSPYGDISIKTMIPYKFIEKAESETLDFLTIFFPQIMNQLAVPILGVLEGKMTAASAIHYIKQQIMDIDDPLIEFDGGDEG